MECAECVGKAAGEECGEFSALFVGETWVLVVGLGIFEVYLLMGHVEVAAEDDGFLVVQLLYVAQEGIFPFHAVL